MTNMNLSGQKALVTGAGSGIGKVICKELAKGGADVVAADIDLSAAEECAVTIRSLGMAGRALRVDVTDPDSVQRMAKDVLREFETIDILVNNAGICVINPFLDTTLEEYKVSMDVNVKGVYLCCKAILPHMAERKSGTIINVASIAGKRGYDLYALYSASKFAVIGLTQSLAAEFARLNININALCPGTIMTPLWKKPLERLSAVTGKTSDEMWAEYMQDIPLGRPQTPEDVAWMAVFLCTEMGKNITGQSINICGGQMVY
jgi:NAD(P)-dependent dehydrogenase (short-subunit alcohol dehydrogenase family)